MIKKFALACAAIALVRWPGSQVNLTGVFTALAAALIGWTQLRKYDELASVYGMSAQKLTSLIDRMPHVADDENFSALVGFAEDVISRENSGWVARRRR